MQTHSQGVLEVKATASVENALINDGDFIIPSSSLVFEDTQKLAKKKTRQWAAWTRQEEENFFNALRQVGKNFQKITCRVQSKNKNQVRHYYYRLVRRMNKLLGPGLCLDAKNSKVTNAAMLRWWSLLEKFSCTASKLHLKPRRFKTFVEALENQLLKDRNKTRRKRPSHEENHLATPSVTTSILSKAPANDARPAKLLVDSPNNPKIGATKGTSLKRNVSPNVSSDKGDLSNMKTVRQKRRPAVASAAYKRWEKAAMAGVSLVADAAEQLERAANNKNCSYDRGTSDLLSNNIYTVDVQKDVSSVGGIAYCLPPPASTGVCSHQIRETIVQPTNKLKLQLFPIDEGTRQALEKEAHNPHLELTLSAKKRISSVLEHLNRKWGKSSIAMGELVLFPYSIQHEDTASYPRWSAKDADATAADVFVTIGSPYIFRLRYGWFSSAEVEAGSGIRGHAMDARPTSHISGQAEEPSTDQSTSIVALVPSVTAMAEPMRGVYSVESKDGVPVSSGHTTSTWLDEKTIDGNSMKRQDDVVNLGVRSRVAISAVEWADSLTTISVGDLLSEASRAAHSGCVNSSAGDNTPCLQQISLSGDSFDAAIAAQVSGHRSPSLSTGVSHASIWNAEETCDEFSFRKVPAFKGESSNPCGASIGACRQFARTTSLGFHGYLKDLRESEPLDDPSCIDLRTTPECAKESFCDDKYDPAKDVCHVDIFWPDSLGLLDLELPPSRYQGEDLIFGESISFGGLSRAIASSVDAFQNRSFFGIGKDMSASEARGAPVLLDNKIGSED